MDPDPADKRSMRAEGLKRRRDFARSLSPETRARLETELAWVVLPHLVAARVLAVYHPLKEEISPYPIVERLGPGQSWALPWFAGRDETMIWRVGEASEASPWGVLQPSPSAPPAVPDIVVVPLVYADRHGTRIGHGKGHYDRALAHLREAGPVLTIGIGWETQISEEPLPRDPWDVPLDAVATPREWIACR